VWRRMNREAKKALRGVVVVARCLLALNKGRRPEGRRAIFALEKPNPVTLGPLLPFGVAISD